MVSDQPSMSGPETGAVADLSKELGLHIVIGVVEREETRYCSTSLLFSPGQGLSSQAPQADADRERAPHLGKWRRNHDASGGETAISAE